MKPSAARVLARLRQRPATTHDLMQADVGGVRFSARVHELREEGFSISERRLRPGSSEYRLDAEQVRAVDDDAEVAGIDPRRAGAVGGPVAHEGLTCPTQGLPDQLQPAPAEHLFGADEYRVANDYRDVA